MNQRELPSGWCMAALADVGEAVTGTTPPTAQSDLYGGELAFFKPTDLDAGYYVREARQFLSETGLKHARWLPAGTVLVTCIGATIGKTGLARTACATNQQINALIPALGLMPEFLFWSMTSPVVQKQIRDNASATTLPILNKRRFERLVVRIAPLAEQKQIVEQIESYTTRIDETVAILERVQRNLKRYRASVLKAAIEGRLVPTEAELARGEGRDYEPASELLKRILAERRRRWEEAELAKLIANGKTPKDEKWKAAYSQPEPPDITALPELPEGWCWTTVDAVGDVLLGRQRAPQYLTGKWSRPYLRVANIKDDAVDFSDVEEMDFDEEHFEKYRLKPGDILVSEGQSPDLLGQSAIYAGGFEGLCFQKTLHRFRPVPGGPSARFAQIVFRAHVKSGVFMRMGSITTNIAHLTLVKFKAAPFPLPPEAEQCRIVAEVERLLTVAEAIGTSVRKQKDRSTRLRQAVLKWAFEGRLVDQDPTDEPASALLDRIRKERDAKQGEGNGTSTRAAEKRGRRSRSRRIEEEAR